MNPKTLKAIRASIRHWKRMKANPYAGEAPTERYCPLCQLFGGSAVCQNTELGKCPIFEKTGRRSCWRTPYKEAWNAWDSPRYCLDAVNPARWLKAAQRMIDFLESLLPKKDAK